MADPVTPDDAALPLLPPDAAHAKDDPANVIGRYIRTIRIGAGGMGEVWRAWDVELRRWVALKFLKGRDKEELARFHREAETAAGLNHPNIAAVYEVGQSGGRAYIAMQLVGGKTLASLPRNDIRLIVELMADAAVAVHAAHAQGIIHRDLKPANLMVEGRRVYVMDFGLAKRQAVDSPLSVSGMLVGTPAYMPPEQARGSLREVGPRSDIYSLGATMYELLTGSPPFLGADVYELLLRVMEDEPRPIRTLERRVDADLDTIVQKCLEKAPERRYATALELAEELRRWLRGEPVLARPASALRRLAAKARRRPALTAGAVVVCIAAIATTVAMALQATASQQRLRQREEALQRLATSLSAILERKREFRQLRVDAATARRDLESAIRDVGGHIQRWPDDPQGYYVRARGRLYLGDREGAERDVRAALAKKPDFTPGRTLLGIVKLEEYQQRLHGDQPTYDDRTLRLASLLDEAASAAPVLDPPALRREAERWGVPRSREDDVMEDLLRAFLMRQRDKDRSRARESLVAAFEKFQSEEYALWIGDWSDTADDAYAWLTKAIRLAPGYAKAHLDRGWVQLNGGRIGAAILDLDRAIELDPTYAEAFNNRGLAKRERNDPAGAMADFQEAVRLRPRFPDAICNLGLLRFDSGDVPGAIDEFTRALDVQGDFANALVNRALAFDLAGETAKADADINEALRIAPSFGRAYVSRGNHRRKAGDSAGALADYSRAIELSPLDVVGHVYRGDLRGAMGDAAGAQEDLDRAVGLRPPSSLAFATRGEVRERSGDLQGALEDFNRAIELAPGDADLLVNRAVVRIALGDVPGGELDLARSLGIHESSEAYFNRGTLRQSQQDFRAAEDDLSKAISMDARYSAAYLNRTLVRQSVNNLSGALADADRAIATGGTSMAFSARGAIRFALGEFSHASADYARAIELDPLNAEPFYNRGLLRLTTRDYPGSMADFDRAIKLRPSFAEAYANRGALKEGLDDLAGAVADFGEALRLAPAQWPHRPLIEERLRKARAAQKR